MQELREVRAALLSEGLISAVGAGRRRGHQAPARVDVRQVELSDGVGLLAVTAEATGPVSRTARPHEREALVDDLLAQPFGNWHIETDGLVMQVRYTKKGKPQIHTAPTSRRAVTPQPHDRVKERLIDPDDPLFDVLGAGADKRRQVDAFLRAIEPLVRDLDSSQLCSVDLGCGNAYLTFAYHRWLRTIESGCQTVGVELRPELVAQSMQRAAAAHLDGLTFLAGHIGAVRADDIAPNGRVDVAMALHACDTATDDALFQALQWQAEVIVSAPCCHHDLQRQWKLGDKPCPSGFEGIMNAPILRERFTDVLTDAIRADLLRQCGYDVDVIEFVDSRHTPRNALIRAKRRPDADRTTGAPELPELAEQWGLRPRLWTLLRSEAARSTGNELDTSA